MASPTYIPSPYPSPQGTPNAPTGLRPGLEAFREGLHEQPAMLDPEIRAKLEETYGKRLSETDQRISEHRQNVAKAYTDRYSALADALKGTSDAA